MKLRLLAPLAVFPAALFAAQEPLPDFNSNRIGVPPLSLAEIDKSLLPLNPAAGTLTQPKVSLEALKAASAASRRIAQVSGMPVIEPNASVDYSMRVKTPEADVDYKLVIKDPGIERAK